MDVPQPIIAGTATIVSAVVTLLLKEYFDKKKNGYEKVDSRIKDVIYGKWKGNFEQIIDRKSRSYELEMELKVSVPEQLQEKQNILLKLKYMRLKSAAGFTLNDFLKWTTKIPIKLSFNSEHSFSNCLTVPRRSMDILLATGIKVELLQAERQF